MNGPNLGKIPTPLETVDVVADVVNQVFSTPARVAGNVLAAAGQTFKNLEADIARPRNHGEIPPPPDVLAEPAFAGVGHIVEGVINVAKGAADGVIETVDGVRREVQNFVRR